MTRDDVSVIGSDDVDLATEERAILQSARFVAVWSANAAGDPSRVKRQTLLARQHDVPIVAVLIDDTPLPPWLDGADTIRWGVANARMQRGEGLRALPEGKVLGPWVT